ncbi:TspO/MBR family protein [Gaetbulibacter aestuarii]|uniref:TspO/MBR family protein n=1 Tax=Gaetbulibacter aestuarii TaxID=1502358 RepID=A0ABW7MZW2_9FLAO
MKFAKYLTLFLIINFGALGLGTILMNNGPQTAWYTNLNQAPWTPPGWFFGVAWTTIMICFSIYLAFLYPLVDKTKLLSLFAVQFFFNVIWNYIFFNQHLIGVGLISIILLTIVVGKFLFDYRHVLKTKTWLIAPYFIWLCIACSLNAYILFNN